MNTIFVDHEKQRLLMDRTFAKLSANVRSPEYEILQRVRRDYPNYAVVRREIKKNSGKESYRGLTYADMERYIKAHNVDVTVGEETKPALEVFYELCGRDKEGKKQSQMAVATYGEVKQWFLIQYPDIENTAKRIRTIMDEARRIRAERAEKESA